MHAQRLLIGTAKSAITCLIGLWTVYMALYLAVAEMTAIYPTGLDPLKDAVAQLAETVGRIAALGSTPSPTIGVLVLAGAIGCRIAKTETDKLTKRLLTNKTDADKPDNLPAANEPVVTTTAPRVGFTALENASIMVSRSLSLPAALDTVIAHEELYARRLEQDRYYRSEQGHYVDELMYTGPVQAILLDPTLAKLPTQTRQPNDTTERRIERVKHIIDTTHRAPIGRQLGYLLLTLIGIAGFITLHTTHVLGLLIALPGAILCAAELGRTLRTLHRHGVRLRGPLHIEVPARYPTISLDDGLHLATLTPNLWQVIPPTQLRELVDEVATNPVDQHPSAAALSHSATTKPAPTPAAADRARRITHIRDAVTELDAEWLDYQLDLHAWFLSKPQLRNLNDPIIKKYREAQAGLRDLAADLTEHSTDAQITAAETAARTALKAWGTANTHALEIGVSTLSPSEEAALHTLHGLVGQLNDRATPKAMWPQLITAITRTMDKLTTVPFALSDIATLPVIEAESRLRAIEQKAR